MINVQNKYQKELSNFYWENNINGDVMKIQQIAVFAELVVEKNKQINVISRKDIDNMIE